MNALDRTRIEGKIIDGHAHAGVSLREYSRLGFPYCQDVESLACKMKINGVDAAIVFPFSADLYFDLEILKDKGRCVPAGSPLSETPFGTENQMLFREIYDFCPEYSDRFIPFVCADPRRDVPGQIRVLEEIERKHRICGFKILPVSIQVGIKNMLRSGGRLLDFARERNIPFLFHVTIHPDEKWSQATDALEVARRNPDIRFCFAHCCGFDSEILRHSVDAGNVWVDTAALTIQVQLAYENSPLMAGGKRRFQADYSDHTKVMRSLARAFPDRLIWGSDSPAYSYICDRRDSTGNTVQFRLKATYEQEKQALDALPTSQRMLVGGRNQLEFLFGKCERNRGDS
ncbi:MAG TPA: amidohydrolase family protein [Candidatus Brocadiia bacterium]|nr:amidohydrolase family protein [Candidatus Brocadiia bacterium]